ncbi:DUF3231 family protein [Oceanobacillus luteolus]|uniref:DUF3231 family protein n=1 Tax=Oceanobacillus luteolus TaxID=1274358 RepID=A0ABW4HN60_9BACI|nr:DUF3231 family protein [Oceanobacillus luteolus]MCM3740060.1 DUF3231 family protein [Oceanobacillus luteolus]
MGIFSGNPKEQPLHYGEVFGIWSYLMTAKGTVAANQTQYNHAGDEDLKKMLEEAIRCSQEEIKQIEALLKVNGVGLPPTPPERPHAHAEDIPVGARFADQEMATMLGAQNSAGLVACSTIMGESIREDIAMMFGQFHMQKASFGGKLLRMMKEKGWIVPPPLHNYRLEDH